MTALQEELLAVLRSPEARAAIADVVRTETAVAVREELERRTERLEPLAAILGCSTPAASMRITRDPALAALGVRVGKSWRFKRSVVERYYAERSR